MICKKCGRDMWMSPVILPTYPAKYHYKCYCGHSETVTGFRQETWEGYRDRMEEKSAETKIVYTIGYGNRNPTQMMELLERHDIRVIIDVRANALSSWCGQYKFPKIKDWLWEEGRRLYIWFKGLGNHEHVAPELYKPPDEQLDELRTEIEWFGSYVALWCAELNPEECHRKKIAEALHDKFGYIVKHV